MVAVVTGSAGFIGRHLVAALARHGPVIGIDRRTQPARPGLLALRADLLDDDPRVGEALTGASIVFHLAGCPDVRDSRPDIESHRHRDNVAATAAVLARTPAATPLLVTSSSSVYGGSRDGRACAETDRLHPRGGYSRSKIAMEQLCADHRRGGGRIVVVRPFTVAGEGQRPGMALAGWITAARASRPLRVFGSLHRSRDLTDVRDAVRALVELGRLAADGAAPDLVNLGTGTGVQLGEILDALGRALGVPVRPVVEPAAAVEVPHTLADTTRLRAALGWVPHTDLDALVTRQLAEKDQADPAGGAESLRPAG